MSGALRKLRKNIESKPLIVFVPSESDPRVSSVAKLTNTIIITDHKLYTKVLEGAADALYKHRRGVTLGSLIEARPEEREAENDRSE